MYEKYPKSVVVLSVPQQDVNTIREWIREAILRDGNELPEAVKELFFSIYQKLHE